VIEERKGKRRRSKSKALRLRRKIINEKPQHKITRVRVLKEEKSK